MCCCFDTINTSEVGIVERLGKFDKFVEAGLFFYIPPFQYLAGKLSLRVQQLQCLLETKTKDNVFVQANVTVQYQFIPQKIYAAFYILENHEATMRAYVADTVRSELTSMPLDDAFAAKDEISNSIKAHLQDIMSEYGISILNALVTDLSPAMSVRDAMNDINAAKRQKEAAYQKAEGEKIIKVKNAEANMESMYLSGKGVASQRKAIMSGLKESIVEFNSEVSDTRPKEIMDLLVLNQYFDTISEISTSKKMKVVFLPSDDNSMRNGILQANAATK